MDAELKGIDRLSVQYGVDYGSLLVGTACCFGQNQKLGVGCWDLMLSGGKKCRDLMLTVGLEEDFRGWASNILAPGNLGKSGLEE